MPPPHASPKWPTRLPSTGSAVPFTSTRPDRNATRPFVEFTWEGNDEMDQVYGRGWAVLAEDGTLVGHLHIHLGEDSGFRATPLTESGKRSGR